MKKVLYICGLFFLVITGMACSDDFLSKNNSNVRVLSDTLVLNNLQEKLDTALPVPVLKNTDFTIFIQPRWLLFSSMNGRIDEGILPLSFRILKDRIPSGFQTTYGILSIDVRDIGLISFTVAYENSGLSLSHYSPLLINFHNRTFFTTGNSQQAVLQPAF